MEHNADADHLRLLSVFHYVLAGLMAAFSLLPIIHLTLGIVILMDVNNQPRQNSPPAVFGWMFVIIPAVMMVLGFATSLCVAIAGHHLSKRRNYMFCLVIAGIESMFMPIGTALGVFTIIVLMRPTVKALFGQSVATGET